MDEGLAATRLLLLPRETMHRVLLAMPVTQAADLLAEVAPDRAREALRGMPSARSATVLAEMPDDKLTAILLTEPWTSVRTLLLTLPPARIMALRVPELDAMARSTDTETRRWAGDVKSVIAHAPKRMAADLAAMPTDRATAELDALPADRAAAVIAETDEARAAELLSSAPTDRVARILGGELSDGARFLAKMPTERVSEVLAELPPGRADHLLETVRIGRLPPAEAATALLASTPATITALEAGLGTPWLLSLLTVLPPERAAAILSTRIPAYSVPPAVIAAIQALPTSHQATVLAWLPADKAARVVAHLDDERLRLVLTEMPTRWATVIVAAVSLSRRRALLASLPKHVRNPLVDAAKANGTAL
ncbi:magnesium transporter MgtE N-terminal domain-containing protein [Micromonospora sp. NBS 11-29]|uniref:magnesium transporter MgtE N-terminal domain-containing protein n=1 Tax=Micromonospora sp. NBS 11-29 TaxID=1960879 RepID=UPI003F8EF867